MSVLKSDSLMWVVADHGSTMGSFTIVYGPTTEEDAVYYVGRCPRYELIELKVVSRVMGVGDVRG